MASTEIVVQPVASTGAYLGLDNVSVVEVQAAASRVAAELGTNGGFEVTSCPAGFAPDENGLMTLPMGSTAIPGWATSTAELAWGLNGNPFRSRTPHGSLFLDLTGYHDAPPYGGVAQTMVTTTGPSFRLSFALGADQDRTAYSGSMSVEVTAGGGNPFLHLHAGGDGQSMEDFHHGLGRLLRSHSARFLEP